MNKEETKEAVNKEETKEAFRRRPIPPRLAARLAEELTTEPKLTRQEVNVLALIANGYNGKQIAKQLVISPWTVQSYQKRLRNKLQAHTMAHAVALALKEGLLDPTLIADR